MHCVVVAQAARSNTIKLLIKIEYDLSYRSRWSNGLDFSQFTQDMGGREQRMTLKRVGPDKNTTFFSNDIFSSLSSIIFEWYWHIRSALWGLFNRIFRTQLSTRPRRCMFTNSFLFLFLQTTSVFLAKRPLGPQFKRVLKVTFSKGPTKNNTLQRHNSTWKRSKKSYDRWEAVSFQ